MEANQERKEKIVWKILIAIILRGARTFLKMDLPPTISNIFPKMLKIFKNFKWIKLKKMPFWALLNGNLEPSKKFLKHYQKISKLFLRNSLISFLSICISFTIYSWWSCLPNEELLCLTSLLILNSSQSQSV